MLEARLPCFKVGSKPGGLLFRELFYLTGLSLAMVPVLEQLSWSLRAGLLEWLTRKP